VYILKKTRFLALALVVAVMLMGAGYAAWNETIKLDASVTSTYLNIGLEQETETTYANGDYDDEETFDPEAFGTTCKVTLSDNQRGKATNSSKAKVEFKNLFPGVTQTATLRFINDSKIPVRLTEVAYSDLSGIDSELLEATTIMITSYEKDSGKAYSLKDVLEGNTYVEGGNPEINPDVILEPIAPGETLTYIIEVALPYESGNETQLKSFDFDITHTWTQK